MKTAKLARKRRAAPSFLDPRGGRTPQGGLGALVLVALAAISLGGCIVAPVRPAYAAPAGVVYVGPTYAVPGPGYVWAYHAGFGWGWHHPHYGWHRGWR